ncbi:MAG TPA: hypothetical protein VHJ37_07925 [Thermoleophilaceae bacterium]|jgi:hypothetical protein|nr:hypothetical protein [Thermoleophilaceae bacterium]
MRRGLCAAVIAATLAALAIPTAASAQGSKPSKRCDFTDPAVCLYPWPNDLFTKRDRTSETGRRLKLKLASMPKNKDGKPINPRDMNRADGFSPGSMMITKVPGLETVEAAARSKLPPIGDLSRSLAKRSPVVVINARTGKRHPVWAEIDSNPESPSDRVLIIRPGRNFKEGGRYIVALRNLKNANGQTIPAGRNFRLYRDRVPSGRRLIERRREHFEELFTKLRKAGVRRGNLYLTWDFTVASRESLTGRALHIRDRAFRALGDSDLGDLKVEGRSPAFTVDLVQDRTPAQDDRVARRIEGTITVPCFLTNGCAPGGRFAFNKRGLPKQQGTSTYRWFCNIPRSALDPAAPPKARPSLYGHGLLGNPTEFDAGNVKSMGNEHNFVFCATAWAGFASEDLPNIISVLGDLSKFNTVADRMQQGFLQQLYLGRALIHPQGLSSHPAFQKNGQSVIDTSRLFFDGNSQGGIMGGALTALAPDYDRAVLGVPGMNYSTLLQRSVDFDEYAPILYGGYPNELERQLWLAQIQLLWDRGESNGYAHHVTTKPLPNTPKHTVLMHVAFGDHQVADFTTSIMARTFGARVRQPALDPGRSPFTNPWYGLKRLTLPSTGSGVVWWDVGPVRMVGSEVAGTGRPPLTNTPPREGEDPHGAPRSEVSARVQKSEFLKIRGRIVEVCGSKPCYARGWTGAP